MKDIFAINRILNNNIKRQTLGTFKIKTTPANVFSAYYIASHRRKHFKILREKMFSSLEKLPLQPDFHFGRINAPLSLPPSRYKSFVRPKQYFRMKPKEEQ